MSSEKVRLPPGCGASLHEPLLFNPYADAFMRARRLRFCLTCKTVGSMDENCRFTCGKCATVHTSNITAPRVFDRFSLLAGRGGGKTLIGAHAAREEMMAPKSIGWVLGPTYKILHDSTIPILVGLIPPDFVKRWDPEHMEITLRNDAMVAFRSLEDPDRARGPHGVAWGWFDEAAQSPARAYDVFEPTLIKAGGIIICTTTPLGYDWTYDKIERRATQYKEPGYFSVKWWTEENPLFKQNATRMAAIERSRKSMTPEFFAQEYRAERHNAEGLVYNYKTLETQYLPTDEAVRKILPEWPAIDPSRQILIGLDSGANHPFGAVMAVVTERGLVVVRDYLQRMQAVSEQLAKIIGEFHLTPAYTNLRWAANKNEANLRLEFGLKGIGVIPAEAKHEVGIQRVQTWLHTGQLFIAYTANRTYEQMRAYRYATALAPDGSKKKEAVFKLQDELPDGLRYLIMAWPELPKVDGPALTPAQEARWNNFDEGTRQRITAMREFDRRDKEKDLQPTDASWPLGDFWGTGDQSPW